MIIIIIIIIITVIGSIFHNKFDRQIKIAHLPDPTRGSHFVPLSQFDDRLYVLSSWS
jgi:hypothetical protein